MAWKPYQDQENRVYSSILTTLFPEQTKTIPRIIIWSIIFLADLIAVVGCSFSSGLLVSFSRFTPIVLFVVCVALFWLQGVIWGAVMKLFTRKSEENQL